MALRIGMQAIKADVTVLTVPDKCLTGAGEIRRGLTA